MDYRDFRYFRVFVAKFDSQPHLVGREALLDRQNGRAFFQSE
jgi:hypothetical protein